MEPAGTSPSSETMTGDADRAFAHLVARLRAGQLEPPPTSDRMEALQPGDVEPWPAPGSARARELRQLGEEAFRAGQVASLVLAGGAGTRFGGAVKALVPVVGGRTFLDFKLAEARAAAAAAGRPVPLVIMTSPLTHEGIAAHVRGQPDVWLFEQRMLPRLTPELEPFLDHGERSLAPAGHGDVFRALRESGVGAELARRGVRLLYFTNVDNLAASLDPVVIGAHLALGREMLVEVTARRRPGDGGLDAGAAPVRVDGRVQLVEHVDPKQHPLISTNDITFELPLLLERDIQLPWRVAKKTVDGRTALQLEQVTGEVTGVLGPDGRPVLTSAYLEVPRDDLATTRFEPVKAREDLPRTVALLEARRAV